MSSPVVESYSNGNTSVASTSHTVTFPSGLTAGDLMVCFFCRNSSNTITDPAGWTELDSTGHTGGGFHNYAGWKIADAGDVSAGCRFGVSAR